jgi:hypothetical protein
VQWVLADVATQIAAAQPLIFKAAAARRSASGSRRGCSHGGLPRAADLFGSRQLRKGRHASDDQHREIEHGEADRDGEKPSVQFARDPVEADQMLLHRDLAA